MQPNVPPLTSGINISASVMSVFLDLKQVDEILDSLLAIGLFSHFVMSLREPGVFIRHLHSDLEAQTIHLYAAVGICDNMFPISSNPFTIIRSSVYP
jgi:hypothetical protein